MHKIRLFYFLLSLNGVILSLQGVTVRVFPLAYDNNTKEWLVLLGHNETGNTWSEFSQAFSTATGKELELILTVQTNKLYLLSDINNTVTLNPISDESLYFIEVPYRPLTGFITRSLVKDEFIWIPIPELLSAKIITRKHHIASGLSSDDAVAAETLKLIQQYVPTVLLQFQNISTISIVPLLLQFSTELEQLHATV